MYNKLFENAAKDIQTTRSIVRINQKLREIKSKELELNSQSKLLEELINIIPTEQEWMVYEHCSIVTRLYSIYESFVENIINKWIEQLPTIIKLKMTCFFTRVIPFFIALKWWTLVENLSTPR